MKLKTKVSLILIFVVISVCSLFAACKIGEKSWQETLGDAQYQYVTYYACGGNFSSNSKKTKDIYYPADTPTITDGEENHEFPVTKQNCLLKGLL